LENLENVTETVIKFKIGRYNKIIHTTELQSKNSTIVCFISHCLLGSDMLLGNSVQPHLQGQPYLPLRLLLGRGVGGPYLIFGLIQSLNGKLIPFC